MSLRGAAWVRASGATRQSCSYAVAGVVTTNNGGGKITRRRSAPAEWQLFPGLWPMSAMWIHAGQRPF